MDQQEINDYIVKRLIKSIPQNEVVREVCQKTGMYWTDAEALVQKVHGENRQLVSRKQAPILLGIAFLSLGLGLALLLVSLISIVTIYNIVTFSPFGPLNAANALIYAINFAPWLVFIGIFGAGMMAASLVGMWDTWRSFFKKS
jgi:uncharacterized membrane protein